MLRSVCFVTLIFLLTSCVKDAPLPSVVTSAEQNGLRIFILNEGNFGTGNASLSQYDDTNGDLVEDIYKQVNSENLGDVLQSMTLADRNFYLVMNNSGKVIVCDKQLKKLSQISGLQSPRYFFAVDRHKGYVTDLAANKIHVVDLRTFQVTGSIRCPGWTEHLARAGDQVIVTNLKSEYAYFIDPVFDKITDSVKVGFNASGLVVDDLNKVWILTGGDQSKKINATLNKIDPSSHQRIFSRSVGAELATGLCTNGQRDNLYYLAKHIYKLNINDTVTAATQIISGADKTIYGFGVHPDSEKIFVADAVDFSQRSNIYEYSAAGNEIRVFKAGIISNGFYFE